MPSKQTPLKRLERLSRYSLTPLGDDTNLAAIAYSAAFRMCCPSLYRPPRRIPFDPIFSLRFITRNFDGGLNYERYG